MLVSLEKKKKKSEIRALITIENISLNLSTLRIILNVDKLRGQYVLIFITIFRLFHEKGPLRHKLFDDSMIFLISS